MHPNPLKLMTALTESLAFHAGDRGSNPLGDATNIKKGLEEILSPFLFLEKSILNTSDENHGISR